MIAENHHHHQTRESLLTRSEISMTKLLTATREKQVPLLKKMLDKLRGNNNPNKIRAKLHGSQKKKETGALGKFMLSLKFGGVSSNNEKDDSVVSEAPLSDIDSYRGSIANVELSPDEYFLFKQTLSGVGLHMDKTEEEGTAEELAEEEEDKAEVESLEDRIRKFLNTGSGTADSPGRVAKMRKEGDQVSRPAFRRGSLLAHSCSYLFMFYLLELHC
jgi:hypothetical protein